MKKTALVISGGGSKGAFAVGAIWSLYNRFIGDGWFSIVGGCSTGALIAPLAALLGAPEPMGSNALKTMVYFYTHLKTHDVLTKKNIIGLLHEQNCLNRYTPLKKRIHALFIPECFEWLKSSDAPYCYVVYVNYQSGRKVFISPKDEGISREAFIDAMLASVSVPVFVEPTIIDGDSCFDGGVRDIVPFDKAVELGAETILPIFLHPPEMDHTDNPFKRIDKVLQRTLLIMMDETLRNDYEMAKLLNQGAQLRNEILGSIKGKKIRRKIEGIFNREEYSKLVGQSSELINIIEGIRPDYTLTEDTLSLDPVLMKKWMKLGKAKADEVVTNSPFTL